MSSTTTTTTRKKTTSSTASAFTSVAAQLLLRHGGRETVNGDSIVFFSDLRKCQPEPRVSGQSERGGPGRPEDGRGTTTRRRGHNTGSVELLSSEIGKHDYDWLLTPPASPLRAPATSSSGHQVSTAVSNQPLKRAGSASYAKSNSRLGRTTGQETEKEKKATSRLARVSSISMAQSTINATAVTSPGGHLSHIRTLSSASVSSTNTEGSNVSTGSAPSMVPPASSPRTPVSARSTARLCRRESAASGKSATVTVVAARQSRASSSSKSNPGKPAPTCSRRDHATPPGASSARSTISTCQQVPPTPSKRANAVARSRLASMSSSTGSTGQASSYLTTPQPRRDVHLTGGARALPSASSDGVKARTVPAAVKRTNVAAASTTNKQRWRQSLAPALAAARSVRSEGSVESGPPINSGGGRKISADGKATKPRASTAAMSGGLARTGSRVKPANSDAPTNTGRLQDAKHGGGEAAPWKPALWQWSSRSVSSMSRPGLTRTTYESTTGSISRSRFTPDNDRLVAMHAAAARIVSGPDAFQSTRYDAMLLREDPKNLTWLRGCDDGGEGDGDIELMDGSLESLEMATGLGRAK